MSRSLLPSTDRRSARKHRAGIHRQARRTTRLQVARFERDPEAFDDAAGWEREPDQGIRSMVCDRRRADKVSPFIRWATAVTRELPWESRRSHIQGLLPKGVIGEHALFHLRHARAFEDPFWREHLQAFTKLASRRRWMDRGEQAELLRTLVLGFKGGRWRPAGVPSSRATSERRRRLSSSRGGPAGVEIPRPAEHGA